MNEHERKALVGDDGEAGIYGDGMFVALPADIAEKLAAAHNASLAAAQKPEPATQPNEVEVPRAIALQLGCHTAKCCFVSYEKTSGWDFNIIDRGKVLSRDTELDALRDGIAVMREAERRRVPTTEPSHLDAKIKTDHMVFGG